MAPQGVGRRNLTDVIIASPFEIYLTMDHSYNTLSRLQKQTYVEDFTTVLRSRADAAGLSRALIYLTMDHSYNTLSRLQKQT